MHLHPALVPTIVLAATGAGFMAIAALGELTAYIDIGIPGGDLGLLVVCRAVLATATALLLGHQVRRHQRGRAVRRQLAAIGSSTTVAPGTGAHHHATHHIARSAFGRSTAPQGPPRVVRLIV